MKKRLSGKQQKQSLSLHHQPLISLHTMVFDLSVYEFAKVPRAGEARLINNQNRNVTVIQIIGQKQLESKEWAPVELITMVTFSQCVLGCGAECRC